MRRSRDLAWDGVLNVRDLGGHPTEDGRETRFGRIVRADNIRRLSDEGWRALSEYGIRTIVDLRTEEELAADPPAEIPVDVVHAPFMDYDESMFHAADEAAERAPEAGRSSPTSSARSSMRRRGASSSTAWAARTAQA